MYDFETVHTGPQRFAYGSEKWMGAKAKGCPESAVPLTVADMEFCTAPEIVAAVREAAEFGLWGYTAPDPSYLQAVTGWMQNRHGWQTEPEWIVPTSGVVPALYAAVRAFTAPGDKVLIQPPVYHPFFSCINNTGRQVLENPLVLRDGAYTMDFEDLEQKAKQVSMMILCSPHNPVGRVWSREELARVAEICLRNDVLVFADEIHGDIIMPPARLTAWGTLGAEYQQNLIVGTAASKTFSLAGLSCSNIFVPNPQLRQRFAGQLQADGNGFNSFFGMVATRAGYQHGAAWLEEMIATVQENHRWMEAFLAEHLPAVKVSALEGSYLGWLDFRTLGLAPDALEHFLWTQAGFYIHNGAMFGTGGEGFGRVNLACPKSVLIGQMQGLLAAAQKLG